MNQTFDKDFFRKIILDKRIDDLTGIHVKPSELMQSFMGPYCSLKQNYSIEHELITSIYLKTEYFKKAKKVFLYHSTNTEMDMNPIINASFELKKDVYMPKVLNKVAEGGLMEFIQVFPNSIYENNSGLLEPIGDNYFLPSETEEIIEVVIPGVCFDKKGNRLGYGGAYYDRYIHRFGREHFHITGLAYDYQLFETLPVTEFDVPVDLIITDKNFLDFLKY